MNASLAIEITGLWKRDGPLTKHIAVASDGSIRSDASACVMSFGTAYRVHFHDFAEIAPWISGLQANEALALGRLREDLPEQVNVVTKLRLTELNGRAPADTISRSTGQINYKQGQPALALIDYDVKGMPTPVRERLGRAGGLWPKLGKGPLRTGVHGQS
jgi:hypothetical protein